MKEIWRDIVGYEGLYQVSNTGKVRSLDMTVTYLRNGKELTTPTIKMVGFLGQAYRSRLL